MVNASFLPDSLQLLKYSADQSGYRQILTHTHKTLFFEFYRFSLEAAVDQWSLLKFCNFKAAGLSLNYNSVKQ